MKDPVYESIATLAEQAIEGVFARSALSSSGAGNRINRSQELSADGSAVRAEANLGTPRGNPSTRKGEDLWSSGSSCKNSTMDGRNNEAPDRAYSARTTLALSGRGPDTGQSGPRPVGTSRLNVGSPGSSPPQTSSRRADQGSGGAAGALVFNVVFVVVIVFPWCWGLLSLAWLAFR